MHKLSATEALQYNRHSCTKLKIYSKHYNSLISQKRNSEISGYRQ